MSKWLKVEKIVIEHRPDYDAPLDYLGHFGDVKGEFGIEHKSDERNAYKFFNAENVENMKQARENYKRMMQFQNGEVLCYGIVAKAHILTSNDGGKTALKNTITSGGLWGIESDSDEEYFDEVNLGELNELKSVLYALGFDDEQIDAAPVERVGIE